MTASLPASAELSAKASLPASAEFAGMELLLASAASWEEPRFPDSAELSGRASVQASAPPLRLETAPALLNATLASPASLLAHSKEKATLKDPFAAVSTEWS